MTPTIAAATIQRIADSGLDLDTSDYRALVEIAQWLEAQQSVSHVFASYRQLNADKQSITFDDIVQAQQSQREQAQ